MRELELIRRDCSYSCSNKITKKKVKLGKKKKKGNHTAEINSCGSFFLYLKKAVFLVKRVGHKSERKKKGGSVTCSTDQNEVRKIFIIYLGSNKGGKSQFKQTFEFSRSYSEIQPSKLTNHSARIN